MSKNLPAVVEKVNLPVIDQQERVQQLIASNLGGLRPQFGFIRIPAGGGKFFDLDDEDEGAVKELVGVLVDHHPNNVFFLGSFEERGSSVAPACWSVDGVQGEGEPGGACLECPNNQFGSADNGRGKACDNRHRVYLLQEGCFLPDVLNLPVMSVAAFMAYQVKLTKLGLSYWEVMTKIALEQVQNKEQITYSKARFSLAGVLPDDVKPRMLAYHQQISNFTRTKPVVEEFAPQPAGAAGDGTAEDGKDENLPF